MLTIESAEVSEMQDSSSAALLAELNGKAKRPHYWKWLAAGFLVFLLVIKVAVIPNWAFLLIAFILAFLTGWAYLRDTLAKTAVLFYQLDGQNEAAYDELHRAVEKIAACRKLWRIESKGDVRDRKYHAGAQSLITRKSISAGKGLPPKVKSNIEVPYLNTGKLSLYFMPDRILIYSNKGVGAVSYNNLQVEGASRRFIESESVPADAEVVDRTWMYVNKKGGPDRRFKDNRELPIALYEELHFRSDAGLNELVQASRHSLTGFMLSACSSMKAALPK